MPQTRRAHDQLAVLHALEPEDVVGEVPQLHVRQRPPGNVLGVGFLIHEDGGPALDASLALRLSRDPRLTGVGASATLREGIPRVLAPA